MPGTANHHTETAILGGKIDFEPTPPPDRQDIIPVQRKPPEHIQFPAIITSLKDGKFGAVDITISVPNQYRDKALEVFDHLKRPVLIDVRQVKVK